MSLLAHDMYDNAAVLVSPYSAFTTPYYTLNNQTASFIQVNPCWTWFAGMHWLSVQLIIAAYSLAFMQQSGSAAYCQVFEGCPAPS